MKFTDIFIARPVLASVVSLFILFLGLRAADELNVRQYPELRNAVINVSTAYVGADADLIQGFITTPLEREIASATGIDYLVSSSSPSRSRVSAFLRLDADPNAALTEIAAKVNKLRGELPVEAEDPVVELSQGDATAAMYMSFYSSVLSDSQITDYLVRVVEPKLSTLPGVQRAQILGDRTFAIRVWLDPERMAARGLTASDVVAALRSNNVLSAVGASKGQMVAVDLTASTDLRDPAAFADLVLRGEGDSIVRLADVAEVELGSENYASSVVFNGENATFIGVFVAPDANALDVIAAVRTVWDRDILPALPEGLDARIPYDSTVYIRDAIDEVVWTIVEAVVIVIVVIFLFLGSLRSVIVPAVAVPLSLVGGLFLMWTFGFSINLMTLLAMVLAIGIVVDDAIIVLENIHRHIEDGMAPREAALVGARELAWPVVAMTTTLIAVYLPIGFLGGLSGTLFVEFAFTLAGAVLISGVVALTLSPMMCAHLLQPREQARGRLETWLDARFESLRMVYMRMLHSTLETRSVALVFGGLLLVATWLLFVSSQSELAPQEDQGFILTIADSDPYTTLDYLERYTTRIAEIAAEVPEVGNLFLINGFEGAAGAASTSNAIAGFVLDPWSERSRSTEQVLQASVQPEIDRIAGIQVAVLIPPPLPTPGGGGFPVEFVIGSTMPVAALQEVADQIIAKGFESRRFIFLNSDLKIDKPRTQLRIDRDKAAALGIDMRQIAADLSAMLSGAYSNRFSLENRSYKVIPQVRRSDRLTPEQLAGYYTRAGDGRLVPLAAVVDLQDEVQPRALNRFQQLNSVTISAVPRPGVALGDALAVLEEAAAAILPSGYTVDYAGQSRQFKVEGDAMAMTFLFALLAIYLVLAAQFESFRDPLIMLVTVPMAICGAMIFVSLGLTTLNIYTQVGLVTLIGVISKHGILIVEFANTLLARGLSKREAIEQAASIRLRPVLMTTASLVLAVVPLLIASGPGSAARFAIGLVIAAGMTLGTVFTLFVLPAFYLLLGRDRVAVSAA
ncbi:MAG TPA: multidrug efflux protein [Xanthomonadales bacterium]|nr:multidrug efflux protein [Xanthomonadales bacterium]